MLQKDTVNEFGDSPRKESLVVCTACRLVQPSEDLCTGCGSKRLALMERMKPGPGRRWTLSFPATLASILLFFILSFTLAWWFYRSGESIEDAGEHAYLFAAFGVFGIRFMMVSASKVRRLWLGKPLNPPAHQLLPAPGSKSKVHRGTLHALTPPVEGILSAEPCIASQVMLIDSFNGQVMFRQIRSASLYLDDGAGGLFFLSGDAIINSASPRLEISAGSANPLIERYNLRTRLPATASFIERSLAEGSEVAVRSSRLTTLKDPVFKGQGERPIGQSLSGEPGAPLIIAADGSALEILTTTAAWRVSWRLVAGIAASVVLCLAGLFATGVLVHRLERLPLPASGRVSPRSQAEPGPAPDQEMRDLLISSGFQKADRDNPEVQKAIKELMKSPQFPKDLRSRRLVMKEMVEAIRSPEYRALSEANHKAMDCFDRGQRLYREGKPAEALAEFEKAVAARPHRYILAQAHNLCASMNFQLSKFNEVIAHSATTVDLQAGLTVSAEAFLRMGAAYAKTSQLTEAIACWNKVIDLDADEQTAALAFQYLASAYDNKGDHNKAIVHYRKALEVFPEDPDLCNNLAWLFCVQGDNLAEALRLAKKAVALDPNASYLDTLSCVHFERGEYMEAEREALKAIELDPQNKESRQRLKKIRAALASRPERKKK